MAENGSGRRSKGEGAVYPVRRDGKIVGWRGSYWTEEVEGVKRRYVSAKTRRDAAAKLKKAVAAAAEGFIVGSGSLKAGEYLDMWLADAAGGLKASSGDTSIRAKAT